VSFLKTWFKIIFINPYGNLSSPFSNKKHIEGVFNRNPKGIAGLIGKLLCHASDC